MYIWKLRSFWNDKYWETYRRIIIIIEENYYWKLLSVARKNN